MTTTAPRPAAPPTKVPKQGPVAWARRHLFRTPVDSVITVLAGILVGYTLWRVLNFVFVTGRWDVVRDNLTLFMVGAYPRDDIWRPAVALIVICGIAGLYAGVVIHHQRHARTARDLTPRQRIADLGYRVWPLILAVLLLLLLADTITPWLVTAGAIAAVAVGRAVGVRLPDTALAPLVIATILVAAFLLWFLTQPIGWDGWGGLMMNLFLASISLVLCFPLGVLLALGRRSSLPLIRALSTGYIELFRGVPLIALLLMANVALGFFLPESVVPGKVVRAIVVFTLFTAAYVAEIVRGGLQSIPGGQVEAGQALGMRPAHVTFLIVLPQALRNVIPALVGQFITLFKDTTLAGAAMGFLDLLATAEAATKQPGYSGQGLIAETLTFVAFIFWVGSYTMSRESQRLEKKLGVGTR